MMCNPAACQCIKEGQAAISRAFIEAAQTVTVMMDSPEFHSQTIFRIAHLDKVTRIIADAGMDQGIREELEKLSVEVIGASSDDASP